MYEYKFILFSSTTGHSIKLIVQKHTLIIYLHVLKVIHDTHLVNSQQSHFKNNSKSILEG